MYSAKVVSNYSWTIVGLADYQGHGEQTNESKASLREIIKFIH